MSAALEYLPAEQSFLDPVRADAARPGVGAGRGHSVWAGGVGQLRRRHGGRAGGDPEGQPAARALRRGAGLRALSRLGRGGAARAARSPGRSRRRWISLRGLVEGVLAAGKFPFVLGGEHSLTAGAIRPVAARHPGPRGAAVRCACRPARRLSGRALFARRRHAPGAGPPGVSLVSVGIRAVSAAEVAFYEANRDRISDPLGQGPGALGHRGDRRARSRVVRSTSPSISMRWMRR